MIKTIKCKACNKLIYANAKSCPWCGNGEQPKEPLKKKATNTEKPVKTEKKKTHNRKLAPCPGCERNISVNASSCPKCGEPLIEGWVEQSIANEKEQSQGCAKTLFLFISIVFVLPITCVNIKNKNSTETSADRPIVIDRSSQMRPTQSRRTDRLPSKCWEPGTANQNICQGEVDGNAFAFCPDPDLYEITKDMLPSDAARMGCENDVNGRLVKVISCTQTTCKYSLFYGYGEWRTMWSQAGIVRK